MAGQISAGLCLALSFDPAAGIAAYFSGNLVTAETLHAGLQALSAIMAFSRHLPAVAKYLEMTSREASPRSERTAAKCMGIETVVQSNVNASATPCRTAFPYGKTAEFAVRAVGTVLNLWRSTQG